MSDRRFEDVAMTATLRPIGSFLGQAIDQAARAYEVAGYCESPIEAQFGGRLGAALSQIAERVGVPFKVCAQDKTEGLTRGLLLHPQFKWKRFRYDFAVKRADKPMPHILIECDGKAFHQSAEQVKNDRAKDLEAQRLGIPLLRFTGSEIFRDVDACVCHVLNRL